MIWCTGGTSNVIQALRELEQVSCEPRLRLSDPECDLSNIPAEDARYFVLAAGVITSACILHQSPNQMENTMAVNCLNVIRICEYVLMRNKVARIVVVGSESAVKGSYDEVYAAAKAGVHAYVASRYLSDKQRLVCVVPPLIGDSLMTAMRHDYPQILTQRPTVTSMEVAEAIRKLLFDEYLPIPDRRLYWMRGTLFNQSTELQGI